MGADGTRAGAAEGTRVILRPRPEGSPAPGRRRPDLRSGTTWPPATRMPACSPPARSAGSSCPAGRRQARSAVPSSATAFTRGARPMAGPRSADFFRRRRQARLRCPPPPAAPPSGDPRRTVGVHGVPWSNRSARASRKLTGRCSAPDFDGTGSDGPGDARWWPGRRPRGCRSRRSAAGRRHRGGSPRSHNSSAGAHQCVSPRGSERRRPAPCAAPRCQRASAHPASSLRSGLSEHRTE